MRYNHSTPVALLTFFLVFAIPAIAGTNTFVEDFTTTTYQDNANTTAYWHTSSGGLKLWNHAINEESTYPVNAPRGVKIVGSNLFVLANGSELHWLEITSTGSLVPVAVMPAFTSPRGLDVDGGHLYIADGAAGVQIFHMSSFSIVGNFLTATTAQNVEIVGNLAFIAAGTSGLEIADITNKALPTNVGAVGTPGLAHDLEVQGDYCYLADFSTGLQVIDISNPATPLLVASYAISGATSSIKVDGNVAYLSNSVEGLVAVDISQPTSPVLLGNIPGVEGWSVALAGDTAFLGRSGNILQIDITNPVAPSPFNSVGFAGSVVEYMDTNGEFLYVSDLANGLIRVMEVLESSPVEAVGSLDPGHVEDVHLAGNVLYGAGSNFYSVDVTDPTNPFTLDTLVLPSPAQGFDVAGDYAYIAALDGGSKVVDVSDPTALVIVANLPQVGFTFHGATEVVGDLCLLGGTGITGQLQLVDVSDPNNPSHLSVLSLSGTPEDIAIHGDYAYITVGLDGLDIVDISNPGLPLLIDNLAVTDEVYSLLLDGSFLYMTSVGEGVYVMDVGNPLAPTFIDLLATPGTFTNGLTKTGTYLCTSVEGEGLRVYDVADPYSIALVNYGIGNNAPTPRRLASAGRFVFQATGNDGLDVVQVMARDFERDNNTGRSLDVSGGNNAVFAARLTSQRTGDVDLALSVNGGSAWFINLEEGVWHHFPFSGSDFRWSAGLFQSQAGVNPTLDQLQIEMAFAHPVITGVADIPNDQGRQVRLTWQFSGYDVAGSVTPIVDYAVYRAIDPALVSAFDGKPVALAEDLALALAGWDFIATIPATAESEYSMVVPTLADSNIVDGAHDTVFFVRALSASPVTYFDSPPDSGHSVDNLAPSAPQNLLYDGSVLSWDEAPEPDFNYYSVFGSVQPTWDETAAYVGATVGTSYDISGLPFSYYHVTTTDFSGNQSAITSTAGVSDVPGSLPEAWALHDNVPNPFNPSTTIRFSLAADELVRLSIFDISGRLVRNLVDGEIMGAGSHETTWRGRDESGRQVATGIYFYRLEAGEFTQTKRMTLVK